MIWSPFKVLATRHNRWPLMEDGMGRGELRIRTGDQPNAEMIDQIKANTHQNIICICQGREQE